MSDALVSLFDRIPVGVRADDDELLGLFFEWLTDRGLEPYPAQEEAILEIMSGHHVVLQTPTGSGKSLVAVAAHFWCLARNRRSVYTAPTKALVNEKFFDLCETFGADRVGMLTGDASINRDAPILCCTAEILSNMCLREGEHAPAETVVMDEFHFYGDRARGVAWEVPLLTLRRGQFLLMSATLGNTAPIEEALVAFTGRSSRCVRSFDRPVPLDFEYREVPTHELVAELVTSKRAPVYLVNFTQAEAATQAQALTSFPLLDKEARRAVTGALGGFRFDTPYGKDIRRFLSHGVGLHHAGLLPRYRRLVERLAQKGLLPVVSGTDTLGVGVNVPIRTVVFTRLCKFDGEKVRILTARDFHQISGRAGRKGFDEAGSVVCQAPAHEIDNRQLAAKAARTGKKKFVRKNPPERGYAHWTQKTFEKLVGAPPEPLRSRFRLSHGMLLDLLQRPAGYRDLVRLIERAHVTDERRTSLRRHGKVLFRSLREAGVIELVRRSDQRGSEVRLGEGVDDGYSIYQAVGLFLLEAVRDLDVDTEEHGARVLALIEATTEDPRAILRSQVRKLKDLKVAELKAQGVEYEARMAELEAVTHPQPDGDWIRERFHEFATRHPWLGDEHIRPKHIVGEMFETRMAFHEFVRNYGLQRVEGGLLRHLTMVYRMLSRSLPEEAISDSVVEARSYLRALLERVDSSLLQEWETLASGVAAESVSEPSSAPEPREIRGRIRAELHALVRALSSQDWDEAEASVRRTEDAWDASDFEANMAPFFEGGQEVRFDHEARLSQQTHCEDLGQGEWRFRQWLLGREEPWAMEGRVRLQGPPRDGSWIEVERISEI